MHRLRRELGSVLVGSGTILKDDPKLTVDTDLAGDRTGIVKVVIDATGRIPESATFLRTEGKAIIVTSTDADPEWLLRMDDLSRSIDLEVLRICQGRLIDFGVLWVELYSRGIGGVLVEGGSETIYRLVTSGEFDIFTVFYAPIAVGGHGPTVMGGDGLRHPMELRIASYHMPPGGGMLVEYRRR